MRVITILTTCIVIVTSFAIHRHANSVDDPLQNMFAELERQLDELPQLEDTNLKGDVALRINSNGMTYLIQQLLSSVKHDITRHAPSVIHTTYLGMELHIEPIQIVSFHLPTVHVESNDSVLKVVLKGAKANLLGQYSAKYRTNREGQMHAMLDEIDAEIELDLKEKRITPEDVHCSHTIGTAEIKLTPALPPQISQSLKDEIIEKVAEKVCSSMQAYAAKTVKLARKAARIEEPIEEEENPCLIPRHVLFSSISDRKAEILFDRKSGLHQQDIIKPRESFSMASVSVSIDYINDYLRDLADKGDIIFHLDRVPKIRDQLRLKCLETEQCVGSFTKLHGAVDGTGHLEAKAVVAPRFEVHEGVPRLRWKLLTVLNYQNSMLGRRVKYLQFHSDLILNVEDLKFVDSEEEGRYSWQANYQIEYLEMSRITTYFESVRPIAGKLPHVMQTNQKEIEALISDHLTANIPLVVNNHIRLTHEGTQYQDNQLTFEVNFKTDRKLFPTFGFS